MPLNDRNSSDRKKRRQSDSVRPFVLGLTGGIGTGKTTAAVHIASRGYFHVDADAISRDLTRDGSPVVAELDRIFGPEGRWGDPKTPVVDEEGSLIRKNLAALVFSDPEKMAALDEFMFARIGEIICDRIGEAEGPVLLDAPLLFEAGLEGLCHRVILLTCPLDVRIARVMERDEVTEEEVMARIRSQLPDDEKAKLADVTVDNSGTLADLREGLDRALEEIDPGTK